MSYSSECEIQIAHSVEEIGQEAWDRLAADRPFASYRWYRFAETALADNTPIYIILSHKNEPVARATFWLTPREPLPIASAPARWIVNALIRRWPLLICRTPLASRPGLILPDGATRGPALAAITQVAQDQARQQRASFLIFDYMGQQQIGENNWPAGAIPMMAGDEGTYLTIAWPDFKSYLSYLSYKARRDYQWKCNHARKLGIQIRRHPMTQPVDKATLDYAIQLIQDVDKHHHSPSNPWMRTILENAGLVDATWLIAEVNEQLVGCALFFEDGGAGFATLLGLDYTIRFTYFQIIYAIIQCAIERNLKVCHAGSGAFEVKEHLGFQRESNNYIVVITDNFVLQRIASRFM